MTLNGSPPSEPHVEGTETHMATHKHRAAQARPLATTGAALLGAVAIVAATPALAPNLNPSPTALSSAAYQLASFADVLRITPNDIVNSYFQGWGGAVNSNNNPAVEPYAGACTNSDGQGACYVTGLSGIAYLFQDALVNGNGLGPAYVQGGPGIPAWNVSAVNYFYEPAQVGYGISGGLQYLVQSGIDPSNPLYYAITLAFGGPAIVAVAYQTVLNLVAQTVALVPVIGPIVANGIYSYLNGYPPNNPNTAPGIPGLLAYVANLLTGGVPLASSAAATASSPAAASRAVAAAAVAPVAAAAGDAVSNVARSVGVRAAATVSAPESVSSPADVAPVAPVTEGTQPAAPTADAQSEAPASSAPVAPVLKPAAPSRSAARASAPVNRPVRDAVEKVGKQIDSALSGLSSAVGASSGTS